MSERWVITSEQDEQPYGIAAIDLNTAAPWTFLLEARDRVFIRLYIPRLPEEKGKFLKGREAIHAMYQILERARFDDAADHKAIDQAVELLKAAERLLGRENQEQVKEE